VFFAIGKNDSLVETRESSSASAEYHNNKEISRPSRPTEVKYMQELHSIGNPCHMEIYLRRIISERVGLSEELNDTFNGRYGRCLTGR
jgi:hypothetical protein